MRNLQGSSWDQYIEVPAIGGILKPSCWRGDVCGVDHSRNVMELAGASMPSHHFHLASADRLPFSDVVIDVVNSSLVMHDLTEIAPAFRKVARVLRLSGRFVFSCRHPFYESSWKDRLRHGNMPVKNPYFTTREYCWEMCGTEFISYHPTFESFVSAATQAELRMAGLVECRQDLHAPAEFGEFALTSRCPGFVMLCPTKEPGEPR